jgi:putative transferase (TIGR04331 family)
MQKQHRFLIATADERTWKFDRPVIFLGDWCRLYNRRHIWKSMDAILAEPYGLGLIKKDADFLDARDFEDRVFPLLCGVLNQFHCTNHDMRFWKILLGHWFGRYVNVMLNRVHTLEQCIKNYEIAGFAAFCNGNYSLTTPDSYSAILAFNDDRWNNALTVRILNLFGNKNITIELIEGCDLTGFTFKALSRTALLKKSVRIGFVKLVGCLAKLVTRNNDAFIINSYLPRMEDVKLKVALGQFPHLWHSSEFKISDKPDQVLRNKLTNQILSKSNNKLEDIYRTMLFELLPVCYLEGFECLIKHTAKQPWPKYPKFIFTSNNFDTDEVFKLWVATKVELGYKYFVGQHGNHYGSARYDCPNIEETTVDKFITWGWSDCLPQHTPAFVLKTAGIKVNDYNPIGGLLLIEVRLPHRITTWDVTREFVDYFNDQIDFVRTLDNGPKQQLTIRLHAEYRYLNWNELSRWHDFDPKIKLDKGESAIKNLIADNRLVVHSYDSTGILETLSLNMPTLAFWQNGFEHLRESAKPYYQILVDAEIVHFSSESVAKKVNEVWDDVDGWWRQPRVQDARKQFCDRFAKNSDNPICELMQIFLTE